MELAIAAIVDAFRNRTAEHIASGAGGLSFSQQQQPAQQPVSLSQTVLRATGAWLSEVNDVLAQVEGDKLHCLVQEAKEADLLDLLKALQHACAAGTERGNLLCLSLAKMCIREPSATAGRRGREIYNFVSNQADKLGPNDCATLVLAMLEAVSDAHENLAKVLELLPKLLQSASQGGSLKVSMPSSNKGGGSFTPVTTFTGAAFRDHVFGRLCGNTSIAWPRSMVVPLLGVIRDTHPNENEIRQAVRKVKREISKLKVQELPPLVYQLLLLSTHGQRQAILVSSQTKWEPLVANSNLALNVMRWQEMVLSLFNTLDASSSEQVVDMVSEATQITESSFEEDELIHVEGTVIHHFVFAVRQDACLAKELLNVLRLRQCSLSPFELALLLSLVRIDRYSAKANEILRKASMQDLAHQHKERTSGWVATIDGLLAPSDIRKLCARVLRRSAKGWDHVVPGIVTFAMTNLEWAAKKCSAGGALTRSGIDSTSESAGAVVGTCASGGLANAFSCAASDLQRAVAFRFVQHCSELLEKVFRLHTSVREEILGQILSRVLTRDESVKFVVQLLARITSRCSKDVIDCLPKIKESLEYLSFMPPATAVALIRALEPALRLSSSLLDYLMIILRKAVFSREQDARMVALQGFLLLAQGNFGGSRTAGSSEAAAQQQDTLALEIIGQLRRTMAHQVQMRERLYDGLCDVVAAKPALVEDVAAALLPQLQRYLHSDASGTRILLEKCLDSTKAILEPIGKLLRALAVCVAIRTRSAPGLGESSADVRGGEGSKGKEAADQDPVGVIGEVRSVLDRLAVWIAETDPEDFDMDKDTDFASSETGHLSVARMLIGMHEVLFEHSMLRPQVKVGHETRLVYGIRKMLDIIELVSTAKPPSKGSGKGRRGCTALDDRSSLFSHEFALKLLSADDQASGAGGAGGASGGQVDLTVSSESAICKALFNDDRIMSLAVETALRQVMQAGRSSSTAAAAGSPEADPRGDRSHIIKLAPLLFRQFYLNLPLRRPAILHAQSQLFKGRKAMLDREVELSWVALHGFQMCVQLACAHLSRREIGEMAKLLGHEFEAMDAKMRPGKAASPDEQLAQVRGRLFDGNDDAGTDGLVQAIDHDPALVDMRVSACIKKLQALCCATLEEEEPEYAAIMAETVLVLQSILSLEGQCDHVAWAQDMCNKSLACGSDHQGLATALVANLLHLTASQQGLETLTAMGKDMEILFRLEDEEEGQSVGAPRAPEYDIVREDTRDVLFTLTTDAVKACCEEVEWVWDSLELNSRPDLTENDDERDSPEVAALVAQMNAAEDVTLLRLMRCVDSVLPLARCLESEYANKELVVKALTRVYRAAEHVAKKVELRRGLGVRKPFVQLMMRIGTQLNDAMYALLLQFDVGRDDKARGKRQKISNESRLVPALVYQVELLEAHLIKIQKAQGSAKSFDLMKHFKRSTARDFKIDYGVLTKLAKDDEETGEDGKKDSKKDGKAGKGKGKGRKRKESDGENASVNTQGSKRKRM